jgi:YbbR domain-containing protein
MKLSLQKTLLNKHSLRMSSLLIGFLLWSILSNVHSDSITVTVPLCLYGEQMKYFAGELPETVTVTLKGSKRTLRAIDFSTLAAHVNHAEISQHKGINLTNKHFLLPSLVSVACYSPLNLESAKTK